MQHLDSQVVSQGSVGPLHDCGVGTRLWASWRLVRLWSAGQSSKRTHRYVPQMLSKSRTTALPSHFTRAPLRATSPQNNVAGYSAVSRLRS